MKAKTLSEQLRIKAAMINLGERIQWSSEAALMDEAADRIEALEANNGVHSAAQPAPSVAGMDGWRWVNGFPPPGELCEARIPHHTSDGMQMLWCEVEVIAHAIIQGVVYSWVKEPGPDGGFFAPLMLSFRRLAAAPVPPVNGSCVADDHGTNDCTRLPVVAHVKHDSPIAGHTDFMKHEPWMDDGLSEGWKSLCYVDAAKAYAQALIAQERATPQSPAQVDDREVFTDGQWWVKELDALVANGTADQKRAVAVVHNLIRQHNTPQPPAPSADGGKVESDTARLDFMLGAYRKVVVERLPAWGDHDDLEVYVEEGFMGEKRYPAVAFKGDWSADSGKQLDTKRRAIDAALSAQQMEGK